MLGYQMSVQYISGRYLGTIIVSLAYLLGLLLCTCAVLCVHIAVY